MKRRRSRSATNYIFDAFPMASLGTQTQYGLNVFADVVIDVVVSCFCLLIQLVKFMLTLLLLSCLQESPFACPTSLIAPFWGQKTGTP